MADKTLPKRGLGRGLSALMADRGPADPEVKSLLRRITLAARIDVAFLLLIVIDMTVKPFS